MHKRVIASTLSLVLLAAPVLANDYLANIVKVIEPKTSQTAIVVSPLDSNGKDLKAEVEFRKDAERLFVPASTMKLLTAVAATTALGRDFNFTTQIDSFVGIKNSRIEGDLFLRFDGDPTLTTNDIRQLFKQLQKQGLNHIDGNLYLVGDQQETLQAPGWVWDDLGICYAAPVSRYILNQNCVKAKLEPRLADNQSTLTFSQFEPISITNSAIFDKIDNIPFCELSLQRHSNNHFSLSGCYAGQKPLKLAIAVSDPALYAQNSLTNMLENLGITIKGRVLLTSKRPANTLLLAQHKSKPLSELTDIMLLKSDNLIADSLLKRLGQHVYGVSGSFINGSAAMKQILTKQGIDLSSANIVDGSGLSRYNLLSAEQLSQVLLLIKQDKQLNFLIDQLPIAGKTGTLTYRRGYTSTPLKGVVLAKTGSMMGVANLAGFIKQDGRLTQAFVILENGHSPSVKKTEIAPFNVLFLQSVVKNRQP
ncbi:MULTISPECIES: D-alanyl-D-alanine carboxypeptidase/D-alanyl-D-alanine-endopeptidase [unclassified Shewanella]|uniref:D-alanyl-D-alanine carboxypeptidase/D-alanyl-D-alanine endopeptidase n=1 Tax=unclassified Shewanella TaxID=196818 RepID=UPI001BC0AD89|nr:MULTISPECIES: D-alanyl-D-alanine carboxypeptidase/D-alanyl-D-alanine-endopeptidase [unclassified Shewanella]GIU17270.1 D-alanyl-D-alanine carboxypeptidase [Shewanella sp. MBTL60-112-B1]GIU40240.1 D-alanyl-D-alanine carboxypeptidase [Shewanella sp. MBTL60-112-B2]